MGDIGIEAVVFDFGNVLARFDHLRACVGLARHSELSPEQIHARIFRRGLERLYDEGRLSSREFYYSVSRSIGASALSYDEFAYLWCDIFDENPGAEAIVSRVSERWPCFLLSNTNELHWDAIQRMPVTRPLRDRALLSFRIGARKPAQTVFDAVCLRTQREPRCTLLVDDIDAYVQAAIAAGFVAVRYDCTESPASTLASLLAQWGLSA